MTPFVVASIVLMLGYIYNAIHTIVLSNYQSTMCSDGEGKCSRQELLNVRVISKLNLQWARCLL